MLKRVARPSLFRDETIQGVRREAGAALCRARTGAAIRASQCARGKRGGTVTYNGPTCKRGHGPGNTCERYHNGGDCVECKRGINGRRGAVQPRPGTARQRLRNRFANGG